MKALAPLLLALAACACGTPRGTPAALTIYGDAPRLETWEAFLVEGAHFHSAAPESVCLVEELTTLLKHPAAPPSIQKAAEPLPEILEGLCVSLLGRAHGGPRRLVLLLAPPSRAELLVVDVPRLAPGETERTFTRPTIAVELQRPAGERTASITRGRVTLRRLGEGRYDVELFAVLRPVDPAAAPVQVVARIEASRPDR